jgi:hypothetical protein
MFRLFVHSSSLAGSVAGAIGAGLHGNAPACIWAIIAGCWIATAWARSARSSRVIVALDPSGGGMAVAVKISRSEAA